MEQHAGATCRHWPLTQKWYNNLETLTNCIWEQLGEVDQHYRNLATLTKYSDLVLTILFLTKDLNQQKSHLRTSTTIGTCRHLPTLQQLGDIDQKYMDSDLEFMTNKTALLNPWWELLWFGDHDQQYSNLLTNSIQWATWRCWPILQ